jgi:alkylation response protein AidB-like acyl-CoA dehydrogenase
VVPAGDEADAFIVPARLIVSAATTRTGIGLFLVERGAPGQAVRGYPTQDGARAAELTLAHAGATLITRNGHDRSSAPPTSASPRLRRGRGPDGPLVAITVEYMNTRKQFGVPIASFQALRHRIADVKMQLELAAR